MSKLAASAYFKPDEISPDILKKIGGTPLVELKKIPQKYCPGVRIMVKVEWLNASGSVKARAALRMIEEGERNGKLRPGMTILDSTSGNTGVAYALIGLVKGYKVKLVMPGNVCNERKQLMASAYHAEVVYSDPFKSSDGAILLCREIFKQDPEMYFWPDQYNNPDNWKAHLYTTAPEIWEQTEGKVTHFLAGIGTSGTIMGTSRGLKMRNQKVKCYAVEPEESLHGIEGLKHMGSSLVPGIYNLDELDGKISVKTEDAYTMVNMLAEEENLMVGSSGGAAVYAAVELGKTLNEGIVVTVLPDTCECDVVHGDFPWNRK
ncbi:MAG: cysteine synthase family protein [Nitrospinota bacterium]|nr:cysteine synthase family protein [Nitrospinota bacterium]MDH5679359.1 cysteine synthase family protein [Nitrospinota bacterium]MDH5755863.1 cysteine synthase family protein [Nitrospinota bacterium]